MAEAGSEERVALEQELKHLEEQVAEAISQKADAEARCAALQRDAAAAAQREHECAARLRATEADAAVAKADSESSSTAAANLRDALEALQAEAAAEARQAAEAARRASAATARALEAREASVRAVMEGRVKAAVEEVQQALEAERRAVLVKDEEAGAARREARQLRAALEAARATLTSGREDQLDRRLVANLVVRYVSARHDRRVLELMARMLGFTDEEMLAVGLGGSGGGRGVVRGLFKAIVGSTTTLEEHSVSSADIQGGSLGDAWLNFLMAESGGGQMPATPSAPPPGVRPSSFSSEGGVRPPSFSSQGGS
eukprot:TRINITY_DN6380_c0_g1_i2.p1 TRINITY_DN6380_c0_g1~~TRINITY_DN6380_c0_g1_i2.p1  ORF type:complete len:315 (+),score=123.76 TRINITY_DN6380_c0_g1_i2:721-1665(+)